MLNFYIIQTKHTYHYSHQVKEIDVSILFVITIDDYNSLSEHLFFVQSTSFDVQKYIHLATLKIFDQKK